MFDMNKYTNAYTRDHYDRINLVLPRGARTALKTISGVKGISISQYISDCILYDLGAESWDELIERKEAK